MGVVVSQGVVFMALEPGFTLGHRLQSCLVSLLVVNVCERHTSIIVHFILKTSRLIFVAYCFQLSGHIFKENLLLGVLLKFVSVNQNMDWTKFAVIFVFILYVACASDLYELTDSNLSQIFKGSWLIML